MKILCAFGEHQYGHRERGPGTEARSFMPALRNLGHEVELFDTWDRSLHRDFAELNLTLLSRVERFEPDLMLLVPMEYEVWTETLDRIRTVHGVIVVCWTTDDSWKYRQVSRFLAPHVDLITTTYPSIVPRYRAEGIEHVHLTQWGVERDALREPKPAASCAYPVSFVGASHGDRVARVEKLREAGVEVHCFGHGWPSGPVDDQAGVFRDSIISLNFANSRGENQIKARTFEVPGAGGFLLTDEAPGLDQWYRPGAEIETATSDSELLEKVTGYLAMPRLRDEIARAGYERTRREHTYEARFEEILERARESKATGLNARSFPLAEIESLTRQHRRKPALLSALRKIVTALSALVWGTARSQRAARRIAFELSWRLAGERTFSARGIPGRMFPDV